MTNEQREVMRCLADRKEMDLIEVIRTFKREGIENFAVVRKEYLDTALSLIKEQQEEIEKKDKQIDLMAEMIDELSEYYTRYHGKNNEFCKEICIEKDIDCRDCIKQYFERKAEDEK